jgi:hypothetical protein
MRIGERINIPVQNDTFPYHLCILAEMIPFHEIANEITYDDFLIITRKIYMGEVIHGNNTPALDAVLVKIYYY